MDSTGESTNLDGGGSAREPVNSPIVRDPESLSKLDWSPIEKLKKKWPRAVEIAFRAFIGILFLANRCGTFVSATVFCVVLPLLPMVLYVAKNGSISRETLIITGIMQVLSFLNTENKTGGMAVFVTYVLGFSFCCYVQDWMLSPILVIKNWNELVQYAFAAKLINGHLLDSFVIVGIMGISVLSCISVFKTYGIGFEDHWFWEDVKRLRIKRQTPKAEEGKGS